MKKLFLILTLIVLITDTNVKAQNLLYHTVTSDNSGVTLLSQNVSLKVSIMQDNLSNQILYSESFLVTSDTLGIVSFTFGNGSVISGNLASINWQAKNFVKIEIDPSAGANYVKMGNAVIDTVTHMLIPNLLN